MLEPAVAVEPEPEVEVVAEPVACTMVGTTTSAPLTCTV